jgi:hypothetical protein
MTDTGTYSQSPSSLQEKQLMSEQGQKCLALPVSPCKGVGVSKTIEAEQIKSTAGAVDTTISGKLYKDLLYRTTCIKGLPQVHKLHEK